MNGLEIRNGGAQKAWQSVCELSSCNFSGVCICMPKFVQDRIVGAPKDQLHLFLFSVSDKWPPGRTWVGQRIVLFLEKHIPARHSMAKTIVSRTRSSLHILSVLRFPYSNLQTERMNNVILT